MEGTWQALDGHGHVASEEIWQRHDGRLLGQGRVLDHGLLRGSEWLEISAETGQVVYTAWPHGQDPVAFPMVDAGEQSARFQNPEHDFPQALDYRRSGDALRVDIRGAEGAHMVVEWTLAAD
jgi:hypothetical protein